MNLVTLLHAVGTCTFKTEYQLPLPIGASTVLQKGELMGGIMYDLAVIQDQNRVAVVQELADETQPEGFTDLLISALGVENAVQLVGWLGYKLGLPGDYTIDPD